MMKTPNLQRRFKGVAAVELAILLIPLVIMAFGMTELGRAFYNYNTLLKSTRDAARHLSMQPPGQGEAVARCLAVSGRALSSCTGADALAPGLTPDMVDFSYDVLPMGGSMGSVSVVQVTIQGYPFHSLVPLVVSEMAFGPLSTTMRQGSS